MTSKRTTIDARRAALERISSEGLAAAVEAAIAVASDPGAPPPARATAAGLLFRAAALGGFGRSNEASDSKEPHEMSAEELDRAVINARAELASRTIAEDTEDDAGIFG